MLTADQLIAHAVGDYLLQSDWMAQEKTKRSIAAAAHALVYSLPFLFLRPSLLAWAVIVGTHFILDRWRLARYVVWAKNLLAPRWLRTCEHTDRPARWPYIMSGICAICDKPALRVKPWRECSATGYDPDRPAWLTVWLLIIADNVMHALCNAAALRWL